MKSWFTIKQLEDRIWGFGEFNHFEEVISYLILGNNKAILFDTGMGIGNMKAEIEKITQLPLCVVNSHSHYDHIGNNHQFEDLYIFENEFSRNRASRGYKHSELDEMLDSKNFPDKPIGFDANTFSIPPYNHYQLTDGQLIDCNPFTFKVFHTPGHSPDSICLYDQNEQFLLSGDTLYDGPIYLQLPESNVTEYTRSIKKLLNVPLKKIYPAHNSFSFKVDDIALIDNGLKKQQSGEVTINGRLRLLMKKHII